MFGKRVTHRVAKSLLSEMGRASCRSGDVAIVAFVMPLDALARLGLGLRRPLVSMRAFLHIRVQDIRFRPDSVQTLDPDQIRDWNPSHAI